MWAWSGWGKLLLLFRLVRLAVAWLLTLVATALLVISALLALWVITSALWLAMIASALLVISATRLAVAAALVVVAAWLTWLIALSVALGIVAVRLAAAVGVGLVIRIVTTLPTWPITSTRLTIATVVALVIWRAAISLARLLRTLLMFSFYWSVSGIIKVHLLKMRWISVFLQICLHCAYTRSFRLLF